MAQIPVTRVRESDYKEPETKKLAGSLYNQLQAIMSAFRKGIDTNNLTEVIFTVTIQIPDNTSTYSPYPISFTWPFSGVVPNEVRITKIGATDGSRSVLSGVYPDWIFDNNRIVIRGLAGNLIQNKEFSVTFKAVG